MSATASHQVIEQGLNDYKRRAWNLVKNLLGRDRAASNEAGKFLNAARASAQNGDWLARQFCTFVQTALSQQGGDPKRAAYSVKARIEGEGDATFSAQARDQQNIARSLVNRSRSGDQVATATLYQLARGNATAQRIGQYALAYAKEGEAAFGAVARHHAPAHHAPAHHAAAHHPEHFATPRHPAIVRATLEPAYKVEPHKGHKQHPRHPGVRITENFYGGSGSGSEGGGDSGGSSGGSSGGGSGGDSGGAASDDAIVNNDQGLHPVTGQAENPKVAALVAAARAGNRTAIQDLQDIGRAAKAGDPRAVKLAEAVKRYTRTRPEHENEILDGHAANLSHSHPLTSKRVQAVAAGFGAEARSEFFAHLKEPYGPAVASRAAYMGQVVGRAQALQAARLPEGSLMRYSPRVAQELGESR